MPDVTVKYLPELTEQEAMRILEERLEEEKDASYKVYKPQSTFKGFVIQRQNRESGMKVAVRAELVQKKSKTVFKIDTYEESAARGWFLSFLFLLRLPIWVLYLLRWIGLSQEERESSDKDFLITDYEKQKDRMPIQMAHFIVDVPEFRKDPAEELGKGLYGMMKFFMKLGGYKAEENGRQGK